MASLASAMEKYNLVGNNAPTSSTIMLAAMVPFLRVNRSVQSVERVSNGTQNPFVSMRRIFQDIVTVFRGINREHEKQSILLDRAEREDDEQRQERINVIRRDGEKIEEEQETTEAPQPTGISNLVRITNITSRLSGLIRTIRRLGVIALSLTRRLTQVLIFVVRSLRIIRFFAGLGVLPLGRILRGALTVAGAVAFERLLAQTNFNERADRFESELGQFGQGVTTNQMQPGAPVRAEGGVRGTEAAAMNFFMTNGFTREQAAGIVGNLIQESGLNPRAHNMRNNENSQGIAQWNPAYGRQRRVADYLGKPILEASFEEQLRAVLWELNGNERYAGNLLRQATTAEQAASIIMNHYERPHRDHGNLPARVGHARRLAAPQPPSNESSIPNPQRGATSGRASGPVFGGEQNEMHSSVEPYRIGSTPATRTVAGNYQTTGNRHTHVLLLPLIG